MNIKKHTGVKQIAKITEMAKVGLSLYKINTEAFILNN